MSMRPIVTAMKGMSTMSIMRATSTIITTKKVV